MASVAVNRIHPTKVDLWLAAVVLSSLALSVLAVLRVSQVRPEESGVVIATVMLAWLLVALVSWPTYYRVDQDSLVVRSGLLHWEIPLVSIIEVAPSTLPISAPAWSLDRLIVRYSTSRSERSICISPIETAEFMNDLSTMDPNLEIVGDRIKRRSIEGL